MKPKVCVVDRFCDTSVCVNTNHLRLGTHADNMKDKEIKGRQAKGEILSVPKRGSKNPGAKLDESKVKEIRERYARGDTTYPKLGREYGVSSTAIWKIVRYKKWGEAQEVKIE